MNQPDRTTIKAELDSRRTAPRTRHSQHASPGRTTIYRGVSSREVHNPRPRVRTRVRGAAPETNSCECQQSFSGPGWVIDDLPPRGDKATSNAREVGKPSGRLEKPGPGSMEPSPSDRHELTAHPCEQPSAKRPPRAALPGEKPQWRCDDPDRWSETSAS